MWRISLLVVSLLLPVFVVLSCEEKKIILDTIKPKQGITGQSMTLSILGVAFPEGPVKATLRGKDHSVVLEQVKRIDDKTVEAMLPASAPPAPYDLEIQFGDRPPITLGGAFEVLSAALRVVFINVGQGDATLLISPTGQTMLIDAGPPDVASNIRSVLRGLNITSLDHFLVTHYDADHVASIEDLVNGPDKKANTSDDITIKKALWDRGGFSKNSNYTRVRSRFTKLHKPLDGKTKDSFPTIDLGGGVEVAVKAVNGSVLMRNGQIKAASCGSDSNCNSIGTLITLGDFKMWTAGDLTGGGNSTPDIETTLAAHLPRVDVYRAHHHGSKTSSNSALLKALSPQITIISAGTDNSYCHPHKEVLERMLTIQNMWIILTTNAIAGPGQCRVTTKDRLKSIASRAVLSAGSFSLTASKTGFSVKVPNQPEPVRWKTR